MEMPVPQVAISGALRGFGGSSLDLHLRIFEVIDMRSFSNLWYWIMLAVIWSSTSHWVLGVPHDMFLKARRQGGQAAEDYETLLGINIRRLMYIARTSGVWAVAFVSFFLAALASLGFYYDFEIAQAIFCFAAPLTLVGLLSLRTASRIEASGATGGDLYKMISRHRFATQGVGMLAIFVTGMYGMWQNLSIGVLN
jgi:hypothetical protein